jgi:hypothetical protein
MGRVIDPNGVGKRRKQLMRGIVLALRELTQQDQVNEHTQDLAAFIVLALQAVADTIEQSVSAWEKRGYWLKADRFRMEWAWTESYSVKMHKALVNDDWPEVAVISAGIAQKVGNEKVPKRHRLSAPWVGAWSELQKVKVQD